ncbi:hypothetical protein EPI10_000507 [Gossypium australe]|uniref:Uncharacterized protein n=1 Tax=Gossypium australe TaxID=47621 RepID=A0A5B6V866_9ROSI|nr:hypothetical protein EPI10_000507 [Gossypium australe]
MQSMRTKVKQVRSEYTNTTKTLTKLEDQMNQLMKPEEEAELIAKLENKPTKEPTLTRVPFPSLLEEKQKWDETEYLADRSSIRLKGVLEDVLVEVRSFIILADSIILDFEEGREIHILLGRPFLAIFRSTIDLENNELTMKIKGKKTSSKNETSEGMWSGTMDARRTLIETKQKEHPWAR